ncbi:SDR family oxidoreductase [Stackebrandtia albiflava]
MFITGATSGLGRALATEFAVRGWHVAVHGRDDAKLAGVAAELERDGATVTTSKADITEPAQVRRAAERLRAELTVLDVVVNNAAVGGGVDPTRREVNSQGTESRMAGNLLAPFVFNRALSGLLHRSDRGGRIVNVASIGQAPIDVDDLDFHRDYDGVTAYCRSKLALIMDTVDLSAALAPAGTTVNAVHPAHLMPTNMLRDSGFTPEATIDDGVLPVLRAVLDTELGGVTGRFLDRFTVARPHPQAEDPGVRHRLARWAADRVGDVEMFTPELTASR